MHYAPLPYLDPGSGSFLIQILIATALGLAIALRASWGKIRTLFGSKPKTNEDDEDADE